MNQKQIDFIVRVQSELDKLERQLNETEREAEKLGRTDEVMRIKTVVDSSQLDAARQLIEISKDESLDIDVRVKGAEEAKALIASLEDERIEVKLDLKSTSFASQVLAIQASLQALKQSIEIRIDADIAPAWFQIKQLEATRDKLADKVIKLRAQFDSAEAQAKADVFEGQLKEIDGLLVTARARLNSGNFDSEVDKLKNDVDSLDRRRATVKADFDGADAVAQMRILDSTATRLQSRIIKLQADADTAGATGKIEALDALRERVDGAKMEIKADLDAARAERGIAGLINQVKNAKPHFHSLGSDVHFIQNAFSALIAVLILTAVSGIAPLVGSLVLLGGVLATVGAGIGLIAAVAAPSIIALTKYKTASDSLESAQNTARNAQEQYAASLRNVEDVQRRNEIAIRDASKAYQDATAAISKARDDAQKGVADAASRYQDSLDALAKTDADTLRAVQDAQTRYQQTVVGYARAQRDAHRDVQQAVETLRSAEENLVRTQQQVAKSIADAYRDWQDAVKAVKEAEEQAARDVADALAAHEQAVRDVAEAEKQGARDIASAMQAQEDAVRNLAETERQARMQIADAIEAQKKAEEDLRRTVESVQRDIQAAYKRYQDSVEAVKEAHERAREIIKRAHEEARQAAERVADAEQNLVKARERLVEATKRVRDAQIAYTRALASEPQRIALLEFDLAEARFRGEEITWRIQEAELALAKLRGQASQAITAEQLAEESLIRARQSGDPEGIARAERALQEVRDNRNAFVSDEQAATDARAAEQARKLREAEIELERARIDQARNAIDQQRQELELLDARANGTKELQAAMAELANAYAAQKEAIEGIREAEKALHDARVAQAAANKAIRDAEKEAQQVIADAIERQKEAWDAYLLAQEEGNQRIADAQDRVREAGDRLAEAQRAAGLSIEEAHRRVARSVDDVALAHEQAAQRIEAARQRERETAQAIIDTQVNGQKAIDAAREQAARAFERYQDAQTEGNYAIGQAEKQVATARTGVALATEQARERVEAAYHQMIEAANNVKQAEDDRITRMNEAQKNTAQALQGVYDAEAEGQEKIAAAEDKASEALQRLNDTLTQADLDMAQALRDAKSAADDLAYALDQVDDAAKKPGATLTAGQQALWDALHDFAADWKAKMMGASEQLNFLGADIVNFGATYIPRLVPVAEATVAAITRSWDYLKSVLQNPLVDHAVQRILDLIPDITEHALNAMSNVLGSLIIILGEATPYVRQFFGWLERITGELYAWAQTDQARKDIKQWLYEGAELARRLWSLFAKLGTSLLDIAQDPEAKRFFQNMMDLLDFIVTNLPHITGLLWFFNGIADAIRAMPQPLKDALFFAGALYLALKAFGIIALLKNIWAAASALWTLLTPINAAITRLGVLKSLVAGALIITILLLFDWTAAAEARDRAYEEGKGTGDAYADGIVAGMMGIPIIGDIIKWFDETVIKPFAQWLKGDQQVDSAWDELSAHWQNSILEGMGYFLGGGWIIKAFNDFKTWWSGLSWGEIGAFIVQGIWQGMLQAMPGIQLAVWLGEWVVGSIKQWFGIGSPATTMMPIGTDIVLGILQGILNAPFEIASWALAKYEAFRTYVSSLTWSQIGYDIIYYLVGGIFGYDFATQLSTWWNSFWSENEWYETGWSWGDIAWYIISYLVNGIFGFDFVGLVSQWWNSFWSENEWYETGWSWGDIAWYVISYLVNGIFGFDIVTPVSEWWNSFWDEHEGYESWSWGDIAWYVVQTLVGGIFGYDFVDEVSTWWHSFWDENEGYESWSWGDIGWEIVKLIIGGLTGFKDWGWLYTFYNNLQSNLNAKRDEYNWGTIGEWISAGIAKGMQSATSQGFLSTAASWLVQYVGGKVRENSIARSPAKFFYPHGEYMTMGIAEGMMRKQDALASAVQQVMQAVEDPAYLAGKNVANAFARGMQANMGQVDGVATSLFDATTAGGPGLGSIRPAPVATATAGLSPTINVTVNAPITVDSSIGGREEIEALVRNTIGPAVQQGTTNALREAQGQASSMRRRAVRGI